jgi:antitoxin ParD1/3/4
MLISLTADQQAWLEARVERGEFASVDEAARQLIDERIAEREVEGDDLDWARPYVEEARVAVANGEVIDREEYRARNAARLAAFKD